MYTLQSTVGHTVYVHELRVCSAGGNTKRLATPERSYGNPLTPTHAQNKYTRWTVHWLPWGFKQYPITTRYTESIVGSVVVMVV